MARESLTEFLAAANCESADKFLQVMAQEESKLQGLDDTWPLEAAMAKMLAGAAAEQRVEQRVLAEMPTKEVEKSLVGCLQKMQNMMAERQFKLCPTHLQQSLKYIVKMLQLLEAESPLSLDATKATRLVRTTHNRLQFFLRMTIGLDKKEPVSTGQECFDKLLQLIQAKKGEDGDLRTAKQYMHLCPPGQVASLKKHLEESATKKAAARGEGASSSKASSSKEKNEKASNSKGSKDEEDSARRQAMAIFS